MSNRHANYVSLFADIANAIRNRKGESSSVKYVADNFDTAIESIPVQKPEQSKTATPTTAQQTISPDEGYALSSVTVNAMPLGSATTPATTKQQSAPTFTQSGATVTANVAATSVNVTPTVVPGYVASGTAGTVTMSANSATYTIPSGTQGTPIATKTISPSVTFNATLTNSYSIMGDANSDGVFNSNDTTKIIQYIAEWEGVTLTSAEFVRCDVNMDGSINNLDSIYLSRILNKWEGYNFPYKYCTYVDVPSATTDPGELRITSTDANFHYDYVQWLKEGLIGIYSNTPGTYTNTPLVITGNLSAVVTPSATDTTGYISGTTKTGSAATVTASEIVSGAIGVTPTTSQKTLDVTNYETVNIEAIPVGSAATPATTQQQSAPTFTQSGNIITANVAATSVDVTPTISEGYVTSGTSGTITMSANSSTYTIPSGSQGSPSLSASWDTHSVTITPMATDTTGYITGSTKYGSPSTIYASDLVSGTLPIDSNGEYTVTNYQKVNVSAAKPEQTKTATPTTSQQTITPDSGYALSSVTINAMPTGTMGTVSATKSISNNTATITPSISAGTAGYNTHAAATGTAVTVTASELVSGSTTITTNTTTNVTNYASVVTNVPQAIPIEISSDAGMTAVLTAANVGKAYKFTGTTGTYINGDIYIVEGS